MQGKRVEVTKSRASQMLLMLAALVLVIAGLKAAQTFFIPVLLAFFFATVCFPITRWLQSHRVPRVLSVALTALIIFAFLAGTVLLGMLIAGELQDKWQTEYYPLANAKIQETSSIIALKMEQWGVENAAETLKETTRKNLMELKNIRFGQIWDVGSGVLGVVLEFLGKFFVVVILTVFMLLEADGIAKRAGDIREARGPDLTRLSTAMLDTQHYLAIKTAISLLTGLAAGLLCWGAHLDFYLLWGILAFLMNFIPAVGSLIAAIPPVVLALISKDGGMGHAVGVAIGYALLNMLLDNFLQPTLMGRRFGLSILVVVLSVLFWGWLWGIIGILLAVPLTMILKVILENTEDFRWIAVAIGESRGKKDSTGEE